MPNRFSLPTIEAALAAYTPIHASDPHATRRAAVAMILRDDPVEGPSMVLIQRADHPGDPWSGQMAFPGGHEDQGDETLEHAARRETLEEIGLPLEESDQIGRLDDVVGGRLTQRKLAVTPFVYKTRFAGGLTPNYEVAAVVWIPLRFLANMDNVKPYRFPLDPNQRNFPSYVYEGYTVWGLTFQMIANFMSNHGVEYPNQL